MVKSVMDRFARFWSPLRRLAALSGLLVAVGCAVAQKPHPVTAPGAATSPRRPPVQAAAPAPAANDRPAEIRRVPAQCAGEGAGGRHLLNARVKALAEGIRPDVFDRAVSGITPIPAIGEANANQPEFVKPVWAYLDGALSARRIANGKALMDANATALAGRGKPPRRAARNPGGDLGHGDGLRQGDGRL